jgi:succinate dehydrogenase / fumarate reductase flavoprotein subunit
VIETVETDVVVIGGGAAGANAALKAAAQGARVALVVKGLVGKSGCSIFGSHLPYHDMSSAQRAVDRLTYSVRYYNHYLTDQDYCLRMGAYMREEFFDDLERIGVYWRRDEAGKLLAIASRTPALVAHKQGASGMILMDKRRRQILASDIALYEECAATSLVQDDGRIVGVTVLDYRRGRLFAISAKAVVLATGHSDYLATRSTGTREQSADGIAMALRAGADLANLEIQWWHTSDVLAPKSWMRFHIYPNPLMGTSETARLYNSDGQLFYEQKTHSPGASAPYTEQIRRLALQVAAGKARWDGGYFSGYDHIDAELTRTYQHQAAVWEKLGMDIGRDRIECGITLHMRQGGVCVDTTDFTTSLAGLYAAGGVCCHYLGGIGPVSYDGKIAGITAANEAAGSPRRALPAAAVAAEEQRIYGFLRTAARDAGPRPIQAKGRIRAIMWELGYVKNEVRLQAALDALAQVRAETVPRLTLDSTSRAWNTGWLDAIDVTCMLDACEATLRSALNRKESRGPFYREDYPYVDNENWLCRNIIRRSDGRWWSRTEPIALPHLKPEKTREPFFEADY